MADQESTLQPGDIVAEYRIEKVLGSGSFGVTYLARDEHLSRRVAIKEYMPVVYARRATDGTVTSRNLETAATFDWGLDRFSEEARTLAQFNHPNIVRVLRLVQGLNGTAYIAMELLEGKNLEAVVEEEGPLPTDRFLSVFRQLLDGCQSIHRIGILHRDIKPANVVVRGETPVLIDFGAARDLALQQKAGFSALVTDGFSPLEQYSREIQQTEATDIYALAATAYFLLSGRIPPPSAARSCGETMPPAAEAGAGRVPDDILTAIDWGLALRMADRPQSIGDWRTAMPSLDGPPATDAALPAPADGPRALSRRGLFVVSGGAVLAAAAGIALLTRDTTLSASARPLRRMWTSKVASVSPFGEPYAAVAVAGDSAMIAAQQFIGGTEQLFALRVAAAGNTTGSFLLADPGSAGHAVLPAPDGGAWIGGLVGSKSLLIRLDRNWQQIWSQNYGEGSITSILPRANGVIAGLEGPLLSGAAKLLFIRGDGSLESEATLLDRKGDSIQAIAPLPGADLVVLGGRTPPGGSQLWISRSSPGGQELWRKVETGLGYANGWAIAAVNGKIYVAGRTSPDGKDGSYRLLLMRLDGDSGTVEWPRWDYSGMPASAHGLAVVGAGSGARLYMVGWAGNPHVARCSQIGPNGDLVWDSPLGAAGGPTTGETGLALAGDGSGFGIGLEAANRETDHLTLSRYA